MDLEIKKNLTNNWFKLLQDMFCNDIITLEKHKIKFETIPTDKKIPNGSLQFLAILIPWKKISKNKQKLENIRKNQKKIEKIRKNQKKLEKIRKN